MLKANFVIVVILLNVNLALGESSQAGGDAESDNEHGESLVLTPDLDVDMINPEIVGVSTGSGPPTATSMGKGSPTRNLKSIMFRKKPIYEDILNAGNKNVLEAANSHFRLQYTSLPVRVDAGMDDTTSEEANEIQAFELTGGIVSRLLRDILNCFDGDNTGDEDCGDFMGRTKLETEKQGQALKFVLTAHSTSHPFVQRQLSNGDLENVKIWNKNSPTKLILNLIPFEFMKRKSSTVKIARKTIRAYTQKYGTENNHNMVNLQWPEVWRKRLSVTKLAKKFLRTAENLAKVLVQWDAQGYVDVGKLHIIGFSVGAHLAGAVGNKVKKISGKPIGRITGLDPLGFGFDKMNGRGVDESMELTRDDASFVDVIHTSAPDSHFPYIHYGTSVNRGHADFYPNNGRAQYCASTNGMCHHFYSTVLFTASINKSVFNACKCSSWDEFMDHKCNQCSVKMGEHVDRNTEGVYYLMTA